MQLQTPNSIQSNPMPQTKKNKTQTKKNDRPKAQTII